MSSSPIDVEAIRKGAVTIHEVADALTIDDLKQATEFSVSNMLACIAACTDADVSYVALDSEATEGDRDADGQVLGWALSHVITHATATSEAGAFAALDLARGISLREISCYETLWETLLTLEQCQQRLNESQRMRLASIAAWPDRPDLTNRYTPFPGAGNLNAKGIFVLGLEHEDVHQRQIAAIVQQIKDSKLGVG
jgi:hypothetical protein